MKSPPDKLTAEVDCSDYSKLPSEPLVSVYMITYHHARFIRQALDSVLMQRLKFPYEICLGEDGSTDGTREICIDYAKRHPDKIRLFLRDPVSPNRNEFSVPYMFNALSTFDACRGKYIALLEGDDYWLHPDKLQLQVDCLEADPALAASSHYAVYLREGKPWIGGILPGQNVDSVTITSLLRGDVKNLHTATWLLRRGKPIEWEWFRYCPSGFYPFVAWTLLQGNAKVIPEVWSVYRQHSGGFFTKMSDVRRLRDNVQTWRCLVSMVPSHLRSAAGTGFSRALIMQTAEFTKLRMFRDSLASFRQALTAISSLPSDNADRQQLRLLAFEALMFPYLPGIRRRLQTWCYRNQ